MKLYYADSPLDKAQIVIVGLPYDRTSFIPDVVRFIVWGVGEFLLTQTSLFSQNPIVIDPVIKNDYYNVSLKQRRFNQSIIVIFIIKLRY